ncbi:hypothetical protein G7046_g9318 [Stylonectria norvegica]|nr:hypothetical protein G7046_g9318 [Stylonectria norvegica]
MRFDCLVLAALPSVLAAARPAALRSYVVPMSLAAKAADTTNDCTLPDDYHVKNFAAESQDVGKTLSKLDFLFTDDTTKVTTPCHFNSTSKPGRGNGTPRYNCDNQNIQFIWENEDKELWVIQSVCPDASGEAEYEVSGSAKIWLTCPEAPGQCGANSTDYRALFTSINPVPSGGGPPS